VSLADRPRSRTVQRYADALGHMRISQLAARPRRAISPRILAVGLKETSPRRWQPFAQGLFADHAPQSGPVCPPHLTGEFTAAGRVRSIEAPRFWRDDADGLLFLFHLHGFSELARYAHGERTADGNRFWSRLVADWLDRHQRPTAPAWHPYPTSERITSWLAAASAQVFPPSPLHDRVLASLNRQASYLGRCVEHDIGGNHVIENAIALCAAGMALGRPGMAARGRRLLRVELERQVLPDGGHEERSPSYHRRLLDRLDDLSELIERSGETLPGLTEHRVAMRRWLDALAGPDGGVPMLNDGWEGPRVVPIGGRPAVDDLDASGYLVLRDRDDQVVIDAGPLCPPHLPPHAHADALSFCCWLAGELLVADPGSFTYAGPDRVRFRGTAAHATVEVDGEDQCDLWGPFRAARLPDVRRGPVTTSDGITVVHAWHDGYRRLADPVVHHRVFCWAPPDGLVVVDWLAARSRHRVVTRLPLAPGASARTDVAVSALGPGGAAELEPAEHAPFLGTREPTERWRRDLDVGPREPFGWALLRPRAKARIEAGELVLRRQVGTMSRVPLAAS